MFVDRSLVLGERDAEADVEGVTDTDSKTPFGTWIAVIAMPATAVNRGKSRSTVVPMKVMAHQHPGL
jgi:hypothetical protein